MENAIDIPQLQAYAEARYNDGGYDVFVETFDQADWIEFLEGISTQAEALAMMDRMADVWGDRQAEARYQGRL